MKKVNKLVSIIIPFHVYTERFYSDLKKFSNLVHKEYEIIIVSDRPTKDINIPKVKFILTGLKQSGPAEKRDLAIKKAKGTYCAFIDDDAYPDPFWLSYAVEHFEHDSSLVALGGPGITPPEDTFWSQLGGAVYESSLTGGKAKHRFVSEGQKQQFVEDWPAYNLIVKTSILKKVGGYGNTFYGGEDTFLCLKLIDYGKILYEPRMKVYHHRRSLYIPHLKQIMNVGIHRGYFFKKFPKTSRSVFYLLPASLTVGFWIFAIGSIFSQVILIIFIILSIFFFSWATMSVSSRLPKWTYPLVAVGIISTHMAYGIGFIIGLLTNNLAH